MIKEESRLSHLCARQHLILERIQRRETRPSTGGINDQVTDTVNTSNVDSCEVLTIFHSIMNDRLGHHAIIAFCYHVPAASLTLSTFHVQQYEDCIYIQRIGSQPLSVSLGDIAIADTLGSRASKQGHCSQIHSGSG